MTSRRTFITALAGSAAAVGLAACGSGSGTPMTEETGPVTIRFVWWGNDTRNKLTQQVIEKFQAKYPNITVKAETGDFSSYWDKLATQVAANDAPDVIQMDEKYIADYASRGALLDLNSIKVDTSKFQSGTVEVGQVKGKLYGVNAGVNAPIIIGNPKVFAAAGVQMPDDATWTWDQYQQIAAQITGKGAGQYYGSNNMASIDGMLKVWLRQNGKDQWNDSGIAYDANDVVPFWQMYYDMQTKGAVASASITTEDAGKSIDQSMIGTGKTAMGFIWSNQVTAMDKATGQDLVPLRPPTKTGSSKDAGLWYKASMYWSAYSKTKHPDAVSKFINFLANDAEAAKILGTERGIPANTDMLTAIKANLSKSDAKTVAYIEKIASEVKPTIVTPAGGGQSPAAQQRHSDNVMFGRGTAQNEAKAFIDEVKGMLK